MRAVAARDHAFASFHWGDESWDVETTNPYGFDPGSRREFHDQFGKATGFTYVPARNYRDRTAISPLELVSLIIHNRIAEAESRGRYAGAVTLALNRAVLLEGRKDPALSNFFTDPRQDLNDRILNYGFPSSTAERRRRAWPGPRMRNMPTAAPKRTNAGRNTSAPLFPTVSRNFAAPGILTRPGPSLRKQNPCGTAGCGGVWRSLSPMRNLRSWRTRLNRTAKRRRSFAA